MARNGTNEQITPDSEHGGQKTRSRTAWIWSTVVIAFVLLVFLLIFILQNVQNVTVTFLGWAGTLPLAVAMLFSAIAGALLVALAGTARILALRRMARKAAHRYESAAKREAEKREAEQREAESQRELETKTDVETSQDGDTKRDLEAGPNSDHGER